MRRRVSPMTNSRKSTRLQDQLRADSGRLPRPSAAPTPHPRWICLSPEVTESSSKPEFLSSPLSTPSADADAAAPVRCLRQGATTESYLNRCGIRQRVQIAGLSRRASRLSRIFRRLQTNPVDFRLQRHRPEHEDKSTYVTQQLLPH